MVATPAVELDSSTQQLARRASNAPARLKSDIPPRRDPGLPRALTPGEAQDLVVAARTQRDRLLLETLYRTGARATEAAQLRRCDIGEDWIRLPNRKQRRPERRQKVVYVGTDLTAKLLLYAVATGIGDLDCLFPSRKGGRPLGKDQIRRIVMEAGRRADVMLEKHGRIRPPWTHALRNSAAARWLEGSGGHMEFAAEQMGHSSIRSMDPYRAIADEQRRQLAQRCRF